MSPGMARDRPTGDEGGRDGQGTDDGPALFHGIVERFSEIIGDNASYSTFHFAAYEEGRRIGRQYAASQLDDLMRRLDAVLDQDSRLADRSPGGITIQVDRSPLLSAGHPVFAGIVLGVLEGALAGCLEGKYKGDVADRGDDEGPFTVRLEAR